MTDAIITQIQERRAKVNGATKVEKGTVIRFRHNSGQGKNHYVAIYVAGRWWTTAVSTSTTRRVKSIMSNEQFMELMAHPNTTKVEIATGWKPVE